MSAEKPIIEVSGLGKRYHLGQIGATTLRESLQLAWQRLFSEKQSPTPEEPHSFWALRDVSFSVQRGEVVGIIGRNGAGKSTLLKILSRITEPTCGRAILRGRVASLLEVGTGFHPELTAIENIYLNGAILGMSRAEVRAKLDEIIAFAGVEKFADTPVKRFSSGMYVRLAFAVAAHLEPEILIVDEVLAVGDAEFQRKALGKMKDVSSSEGRTVLFVSHNMGAICDLCQKTILIDKGNISFIGKSEDIVKKYIQNTLSGNIGITAECYSKLNRRGSGHARFYGINIYDHNGTKRNEFNKGDTIVFELSFEVIHQIEELFISMAFRSGMTREIVTYTDKIEISHLLNKGTRHTVRFIFNKINLRQGLYETYYWLGSSKYENPYDVIDNLTQPIIINDPTGVLTSGYFDLDYKFETNN